MASILTSSNGSAWNVAGIVTVAVALGDLAVGVLDDVLDLAVHRVPAAGGLRVFLGGMRAQHLLSSLNAVMPGSTFGVSLHVTFRHLTSSSSVKPIIGQTATNSERLGRRQGKQWTDQPGIG